MLSKRLLIIFLLAVSIITGYQVYANSENVTEETATCKVSKEVQKIIIEAINIGAPTYNDGNHLACYRIYEGAAYKILFEYGAKCKDIKKALKEAIDKSHLDYSEIDRAWIMRMAFDKILGEPTRTGPTNTNTL